MAEAVISGDDTYEASNFFSFVANPNKEVVGILADNKVKFLTYFGGFHKE